MRLGLQAFASPWAWVPAALGGLALVIPLLTGDRPGADFLLFLGGLGLVAGAVVAAVRLATAREELEREVRDALRHGKANLVARRQRLDDAMDAAGRAKDQPIDPRLHRLRRALDRLVAVADEAPDLPVRLEAKAGELWDRCLAACRHATTLLTLGRDLATPAARATIDGERAELLRDADAALDRLEAALDHLQLALARRSFDVAQLVEPSDELDRGLEIARRVDDRMAAVDRSSRDRE